MAGAIGVLHTYSCCENFHPHVHFVIPAAAIDVTKKHWHTKRKGKIKTKKTIYSTTKYWLRSITHKPGCACPKRNPKKWTVSCKSVGASDNALIYLGRYLYRGVIQEKDLVAYENDNVTFRYQNSQPKQIAYRTVTGAYSEVITCSRRFSM